MRIGMLIDTLTGGGAERITLNFADELSKQGHSVFVFVLRMEIKIQLPDNPRYKIIYLTEKDNTKFGKLIYKLCLRHLFKCAVKKIEEDGTSFHFFISSSAEFDEITIGFNNVYIRYRNSMSEFIRNKVGKRLGLKRKFSLFKNILRHKIIYNNRPIVAITDAMKFDLCKTVGIRPRSICTIYNPFDFEHIRKQGSEETTEIPKLPYIIYAAKFENRKNHNLLIDAYVKSGISHQLVLIGDVYTISDQETFEKLIKKIELLGIKDRVIFPGFQKNPYPWIKNAALFVMSSDNEGLPTVLVESLILGTPVVSTNCPTGPQEILTGELNRFLSPVNNPDALADNIKAALSSYPKISDQFLEKFSSKRVIKQYIDNHMRNK